MTEEQAEVMELVISRLNRGGQGWDAIWDEKLRDTMAGAFGVKEARALERLLRYAYDLGRTSALDDILNRVSLLARDD